MARYNLTLPDDMSKKLKQKAIEETSKSKSIVTPMDLIRLAVQQFLNGGNK